MAMNIKRWKNITTNCCRQMRNNNIAVFPENLIWNLSSLTSLLVCDTTNYTHIFNVVVRYVTDRATHKKYYVCHSVKCPKTMQ